jgi:hypothetical protein
MINGNQKVVAQMIAQKYQNDPKLSKMCSDVQ